ncbi:GDP-mannose 4,6-dehydratase [Streptomonospora sp. S1-112]|uniref:GDP-mannose 4,6-dehydratase n=1 Tax=Streptomonospora mangrovi TaxID=2883123 RepID=A0A9X3NI14_9ACTN|nr:NAD-dependent epimerase/dehydratase family protein [Streptomonospora mangrovi]MDA0563792.1 GDP-mannose 4,6-dehydratase [Streptomonospora mangrovi]
MRVVITGGAGFIGSHLTEAVLAAGHEAAVIDDYSTGRRRNLDAVRDSPRLSLHHLDVSSPEAAEVVRGFRPDALLLLGAQMSVKTSMRDPLLDARVNVLGLVNLLAAAADSGTRRVVFASSGGTVYGAVPPERLPLTEDLPHRPLSFYGLTKSVAHEYLRIYREQYGIDHVALALGNVYGPRQDPLGEAGVISIFAQRMLRGRECVVNGDGRTTRDYVYVADVVRAFLAALERGSGPVNLGTGIETSVLDVLGELARCLGTEPVVRHGPALAGEVRRVCLSPRRAEEQLGWRPSVALPEGIAALVAHLREEDARAPLH